jgi:hypothetical protein
LLPSRGPDFFLAGLGFLARPSILLAFFPNLPLPGVTPGFQALRVAFLLVLGSSAAATAWTVASVAMFGVFIVFAPVCGDYRGQDIHHSAWQGRQGESACQGDGSSRGHLMAGHGEKFGRKKEEAIAALLTKRNVDEAGQAAGIGTRPLMRWLTIPEFQKAYREARRQAFGQSIARLQQATSAAAARLMKIMVDPAAPASVRGHVADSIFNHAAKAVEIEDIEARDSELERSAEASKQHRTGAQAWTARTAVGRKEDRSVSEWSDLP